MELHGSYLSQPTRACLWLVHSVGLEKSVKLVKVDSANGAHRTAEFAATMNPNKRFPVLKDGSFVLFESHAILRYLASKTAAGAALYPRHDAAARARVDAMLDWKHENLRVGAAGIVRRLVFSKLVKTSVETTGWHVDLGEIPAARERRVLHASLAVLAGILATQDFVASAAAPSIADIALASEVEQLQVLPPDDLAEFQAKRYAPVWAWRDRVRAALAKGWDVVHGPLVKLAAGLARRRDKQRAAAAAAAAAAADKRAAAAAASKDTASRSATDFFKEDRALTARAAKLRSATAALPNKYKVTSAVVDLSSDGVRLSATVWRPATAAAAGSGSGSGSFPAILLVHGWGGKRAHLDFSYARRFAAAGFICLTFDYRGWGESDGVVVSVGPQPRAGSAEEESMVHTNLRGRIVRRVVDPEWQFRDAMTALDFLQGGRVPGVDPRRVGVWGSSFGSGYALQLAARQAGRVAAVVAQIGSINTHANWVNRHPKAKGEAAIHALAASAAAGDAASQPWTLENPAGLDGRPALPKIVFDHWPIREVDRIVCPTLLLAAKDEDLFLNADNSELVYDRLRTRGVTCDLGYLPGGHYDAYGQPAFGQGCKRAIAWFAANLDVSKGMAAKL